MDCDSKTFTYIWEVNLDEFDRVSNLYSPPFSSWNGSVEEPWQLQFYPHGKMSIASSCLALFIVHRKLHHVEMDYTLMLINQKDENETLSVDKHSTFENSEDGFGPGPCIDDDRLDSPPSEGIYDPDRGFLVDGKIKIGVRIPTDPIPIKRKVDNMVSFTWDLSLDRYKAVPNEEDLLSPKFQTINNGEKNTWQIQVYPNGVVPELEGFLSLFLVHRGKDAITTQFEISLVNQDPTKSYRYTMEDTFSHDLNGWGEREVIGRRYLTNNTGFVFGDNVRFEVRIPLDDVSINKLEKEQAIVPFVWEVPLADMTSPTGEYLLSPKFMTWNSDESDTWQIQLFPNGIKSEKKQFVAAYLVHRGVKKVDTSFSLFISNQNEENTETVTMENVKFKYDLHGWGANAMVKRSDLEDPEKGFLFDGKKIKIGVQLATDHIPLKKTDSVMVPYTWEVKVEDLKLGTGKYLLSPNITTWNGQNKETWQVQLYPNGLSTEDNKQVSLFIAHRGDNEVTSRWSVSVVNKDPKKTESRTGTNLFGYDLQGWGSRTFIQGSKLRDESEGFIFDGKVKIGVELPSDNITLSIDNECPVIKEAPACEKCPAVVDSPVTKATPAGNPYDSPRPSPAGNPYGSPRPSPAPINASLHNLYRELKLKTPDGSEFSINHIMSFESIEKLISNLMRLSGSSSNYQPSISSYKHID
ncbi:hypothetical protein GE061_006218 [Apolygus lucorum]|uniref:MATH domain-containing protein n=1 Tax=Apolygus lucorum TaxID=248454 RepID=A0A6A4J1S1_APOLU|nr:hypothetical protein GE061_006218 [Apolygus lucorum]